MKTIRFKEGISIYLILLFVYSASSKLLENDRFIFQMRLSPFHFVNDFAPILGWLVPVLELAIASFLTAGIFKATLISVGLYSSLLLISIFEIYIAIMFLSGKNLPCACGGVIAYMSWKGHLIFNGVTILLILTGVFPPQRNKNNELEKYSRV